MSQPCASWPAAANLAALTSINGGFWSVVGRMPCAERARICRIRACLALASSFSPKAGIVVPEDAVQNVGGRNVLFVRTATGFKVQPVVIGSRSAGRVSILSGAIAGQTIATTNAFFLKAELNKGAGDDE